ncbi:hypothetical protein YC2023_002857 [Brassica napus]
MIDSCSRFELDFVFSTLWSTISLLLRTLPLLRNSFLNHRHQVSIAAAGFLSHWCSLADKSQFGRQFVEDDSPLSAMNITQPIDENWRYEDPEYRKWKNLEAEILNL